MTPALAISEALVEAGVRRRKAQAELVGELPSKWSRYLRGHRSPQCSKVQGWLDALDTAGITVALRWTPRGVVGTLVEPHEAKRAVAALGAPTDSSQEASRSLTSSSTSSS